MSLRKTYAVDKDKIANGVPFELGVNEDGSRPTMYIARAGQQNQRYRKSMEAAYKPYKFQLDHGTMDNEVAQGILLTVFCKSCITGWTNVLLSDVTGNPEDTGFADFTPENAEKLLGDLPDLFEEVVAFANSVENYRAEELDNAAKN